MNRGRAVLLTGLALWVGARLTGSQGLHMVALGLVVLPIAATFFRSRGPVSVQRRLSARQVAVGERVTVTLDVRNRSAARRPFLLLEDVVGSDLGKPSRLVLAGLPGGRTQAISYSLVPRVRGRFSIGPAKIEVADPFALTKRRIPASGSDWLVVTPRVERLSRSPERPRGSGGGETSSRHLFTSGDEFFAIRGYQTGDDLRRIHWPSVARTGELMIRQDESARHAAATVLLDTRRRTLGPSRSPGFERAVSAAASLGVLLYENGFTLNFMTSDRPPSVVTMETFLESLAGVEDSTAQALGIHRLRPTGEAPSTLALVTAVPDASGIASMTRAGAPFGVRMAVLVHPADPASCSLDVSAQMSDRSSIARLSLMRAGWEVFVISPGTELRDVWIRTERRLPAPSAR
jgi:uncharacterized protein (DUF58 family)